MTTNDNLMTINDSLIHLLAAVFVLPTAHRQLPTCFKSFVKQSNSSSCGHINRKNVPGIKNPVLF